MNLGAMLTACAGRHGAREAVVCGGERLSFAELETRANRIAGGLTALGQPVGARIALYMPNCLALVEVMAACAKSGAVMVPVSTRLAPEEVRYQIRDSRPFAIVYGPGLRDAARDGAAGIEGTDGVRMINAGTTQDGETGLEEIAAAGAPTPPPEPAGNPDICISYTSGTTGRPKGAVATQANLIRGIGEIGARAWRLTENDRVLVATPMAHRTGIARLVICFCLGSTLIVLPRFDAREAVRLIEAEGATVIGVVPTIARLLLPEIEKRPEACRTLRTMLATGEVFPHALKQRLFAALPELGLYSFYSQTEAGVIACLAPEDQHSHPDSMGRPVEGVEVRIVDDALNDVPAGEPGEVLVRSGGPGDATVMREYFNRPEDTAAVFAHGWLRTGDIARMDADGHMYFVDRARDMIVSGGLNIYSAEVESALARHEAVAETAVIAVPDPEFGEAVLAYVALKPGQAATAEALIDHCRTLIAGYKKPKYVCFLDRMPRNSVGKIAKAELRAAAAADITGPEPQA